MSDILFPERSSVARYTLKVGDMGVSVNVLDRRCGGTFAYLWEIKGTRFNGYASGFRSLDRVFREVRTDSSILEHVREAREEAGSARA